MERRRPLNEWYCDQCRKTWFHPNSSQLCSNTEKRVFRTRWLVLVVHHQILGIIIAVRVKCICCVDWETYQPQQFASGIRISLIAIIVERVTRSDKVVGLQSVCKSVLVAIKQCLQHLMWVYHPPVLCASSIQSIVLCFGQRQECNVVIS